jgi:hypothetical protein
LETYLEAVSKLRGASDLLRFVNCHGDEIL